MNYDQKEIPGLQELKEDFGGSNIVSSDKTSDETEDDKSQKAGKYMNLGLNYLLYRVGK